MKRKQAIQAKNSIKNFWRCVCSSWQIEWTDEKRKFAQDFTDNMTLHTTCMNQGELLMVEYLLVVHMHIAWSMELANMGLPFNCKDFESVTSCHTLVCQIIIFAFWVHAIAVPFAILGTCSPRDRPTSWSCVMNEWSWRCTKLVDYAKKTILRSIGL